MEEQIIISKQRVKDFGEVFTPTHLVKQMCDLVQQQCYDDESTFLEPTCGTGNFLVEILGRKLRNITEDQDDDNITLKRMYVAVGSLYGCDIQEDNILCCRERLADLFMSYTKGLGISPNLTLLNIILQTNIRQANTLTDDVVFCRVRTNEFEDTVKLSFSQVNFKNGTSTKLLEVQF